MKNIQKVRLGVQLLCLVLTVIGFFTSFSIVSSVIFVSGILGGVFFCGWICPFGTLQELFSRSGDLLGIKKIKMPRALQRIMVFSKYIVFAIAMLVTVDIVFQVLSFDPRVNFLMLLSSKSASLMAVGVIIGFGLLSMFFERPFCNYFCIEGAKYGLFSVLRPVTIIRDDQKCVSCAKCTKVCPMNIDVAKCGQMHSPQCINCMKCISECPVDDTLKYRVRKFDKKQMSKYLKMIVAVLLGVIIGLVSGLIDIGSHHGEAHHDEESQGGIDASAGQTAEAPSVGAKLVGYKDGTYLGSGNGFRGIMDVQIIIENSVITKVEVIKHSDDDKWFNRAYNSIPYRIVENQSANVDVVGGATYSSQGIIEGVEDALKKAKE